MASASKPTIVLVPGAWHSGTYHYKALNDLLRTAGYVVNALDLPSTVDNPTPDGWSEDIKHIASEIEKSADQGEDVVLVMHSRGGLAGSDAAAGLSKTDREKAGKQGGIVHCLYMCAFAAQEGQSLFMATMGPDEWIELRKGGGKYSTCIPTRPGEIFYNDCTPEQIAEAQKEIKPMSTLCFLHAATYSAWKHIPSTYLICEKDNAIPLFAQEMMSSYPEGQWRTERCAASHSPFVSMPDYTAEMVRRAAGEKI